MGCSLGCFKKLKKILNNQPTNGELIANDLKILMYIADCLPLNALLKVSKVNR